MIRGQWVTLSLRAAIELGLFDHATVPVTLAALAESTGSNMAALARLVRVLADLGLVTTTDLDAG